MVQWLGTFFLKLTGWKVAGTYHREIKKYIIVVGPHTSNWDFFIAVAVRASLQIKSYYLAKKEIFVFPFGAIFRAMGGFPVDRSRGHNVVKMVTQLFDSRDEFAIALAPEGTRRKVKKLKTGFYFIAKAANIPIILTGFDYSTRTVTFAEPFYPTDDSEEDFRHIINFFSKIKGKHPHQGMDAALLKTIIKARQSENN